MAERKPNIDLRVEHLVLDGFAPADRLAIGEAIQHELIRLLNQRGVLPAIAAYDNTERLDAGAFDVTANMQPQAIGAQIAQRVYQGLNQ